MANDVARRVREYAGRPLLLQQGLLLGVGLTVAVVFWFFGGGGSIAHILLYTFIIGNLTALAMAASSGLFDQPSALRRWAVFFTVLIPVGLVGGLVASLVIYAMEPHASSASWGQVLHYLRINVMTGLFVTLVAGIVSFNTGNMRARLEKTNRQLEDQVQLGVMQLQGQAAELAAAHEIQLHLIPTVFPQVPGVQVSGAWQPAKAVGGDYFDVIPVGPGRLGVCIADVSGKGMGAALLMANLQAAFRAFATEETAPAMVCEKLNRALCASIAPGKFVTFFYGVLEVASMLLRYENAGHNAPLLLRAGHATGLAGGGTVLGLFPEAAYSERQVQLQAGDCLLLTTDGITEACCPAREEDEFGEQRLVQAAQSARAEGAHAVRRRVLEEVTAFCEGHFHDDASLIVLAMDT